MTSQLAVRPGARGTLDLLAAASCLGPLLVALPIRSLYPGQSAILGVAVVCFGLTWWWRRSRPGRRPWPAVVLAVEALVLLGAGNGPLTVPVLLVGVLVLVLDIGPAAGVCAAVGVLVAESALLLVFGSGGGKLVTEVVSMAVFLTFGLAYALLLRRSERLREVQSALLAERDAANAALLSAHDRLVDSVAREKDLVLAQERARSARELHDGLGHRLQVVRMSLDFAVRTQGIDPDRAWSEVDSARAGTVGAIDEMRRWVRALHPVEVAGRTDPAAFEAIADAFRGTGLDVEVEMRGTVRELPADVSVFAVRLIQEALTNTLRHAHAGRSVISLEYGDELRVRVADDGVGTDRPSEGFGLRSLRERAEQLGGGVHVDGADGFTLVARIPLAGSAS